MKQVEGSIEQFVHLKRAVPFVHDQIDSKEMQIQLADTHRSIGDYYHRGRLATGLNFEEEKMLLPILLQVDINNQLEFKKAKDTYFTNIVTKIPSGEIGLKLNIGLEDITNPRLITKTKDENGKDKIIYNFPQNIDDYIRYRHAILFPHVALSPESAKGDQTSWYYIENPQNALNKQVDEAVMKDQAMTEYLKIKDKPKEVEMYLTVLKTYIKKRIGKPVININNLGEKERIIELRDIAVNRAEKFYEAATDKNLGKKYFIEECLTFGVIGKVGNSYVDIEDNNYALGETMNETITKLYNPKESSRLNRLKSSYRNKKENPLIELDE